MPSYWDASGRLVDGRYELTGSKVAEGIADMVLNTQGSLLASAARTASLQSAIQTNYNAKGVIVTIVVSGPPTGTTPQLQVQILDFNGNAFTALSTAITAAGSYKFVVYPAPLTAPSGSVGIVQLPLPRTWAGYFVITGTTPSFTFTATAELIL